MISGVPRGGGQGGHGPWAQDLEGAPAQVVGAKFKSRAIKGPAFRLYALGGLSFLFLVEDLFIFFLLADFWPSGPGPKGLVLPKGGGAPRGAGGGGADASIGPRALETLGTPLALSMIRPRPKSRSN